MARRDTFTLPEILGMAPAELEKYVSTMSQVEQLEVEQELNSLIQNAALICGYLFGNSQNKSHDVCVKLANERLKGVRKELGYSINHPIIF